MHTVYSPLSFTDNIHNDLSSLVRDALVELNVPAGILNNFDSHSTITIDIVDKPSINISLVDDRVFIWTFISISEELLIHNARRIIPVITTAMEHVETGSLVLGKGNDGFELKALINPIALAESKLSQIINHFYNALKIIVNDE